jgi:diaminohydroxyphosphoribosylaminopyrimidine deaminase/5-amino-6-(5-phosphoribosylamino)uracil reductase
MCSGRISGQIVVSPNADERFMLLCLQEATKGLGYTSPNPMVGAVVVRDGVVLAQAHHQRDGESHAEPEALAMIDPGGARGATVYVNLEPCSHQGRTPPCCLALIQAGVGRVVVAQPDPDQRVSGRGIAMLREAGVVVDVGVLEREARDLNWIYNLHRRRHRPFVMLKAAMTMDGRIATHRRDRQTVSNVRGGLIVQQLRARFRALAVGAATAMIDRPRLDCRLAGMEHKPIDKLILSFDAARPFNPTGYPFHGRPGRTLVVGPELLTDGPTFLQWTQSLSPVIDSVLVEGGSRVHAWMLSNDIVDRVVLFLKPSFVGGDGIPMVGPMGRGSMEALPQMLVQETRVIDGHVMIDLVDSSLVGEVPCLPV